MRKERNVYKKINKKLKDELKFKKKNLEKELKEAEEIYIRKEAIRKKLRELKQETEKQDGDYNEELRKLRQLIDQDRKKGIFEEDANKPNPRKFEDKKQTRGILQTAPKDGKTPSKQKRGTSVNFHPATAASIKSPERPVTLKDSQVMSPPTNLKSLKTSSSKLFSTVGGASGNHTLTHSKFGEHFMEKKETLQTSLKQVE